MQHREIGKHKTIVSVAEGEIELNLIEAEYYIKDALSFPQVKRR